MNFTSPLFRSAVFLVILSVIPGCGYTRKSVLPEGIKTIHVDTVKNKIPMDHLSVYVPGLEISITNAIIKRMNRDGNLRVVSKNDSDAVLESELISMDQEGVRFTNLESVEEYRLYLVLAMRLRNTKTGEVIWEEPNFSGDAEYFVSGVRSIAREEAAQRAVDRLAHNVVDRIVEDW